MGNQKDPQEPFKKVRKGNLLSWFVSREEPDKDYMPDLKSQWEQFNNSQKVKFVIGAVVGIILFIGSLFLVYMLLSALIG